MRVLIVEDSPVARIMLAEMLGLRGHQMVAEADNELRAVEAYRKLKPDLVTLDLSLGTENGLHVLKSLRQIDSKARVLVISGNPQKGIVEQVMASGAAAFITKPFTIADLESAIARAAKI